MRAPHFWSSEVASPLASLLAPLSWIYGLAVRLRFAAARPAHSTLPVVCIGNFVAGGAGKTPTALAIADLLQGRGHRPAFLTRGYGGRARGPLFVAPAHTAREVGDEALLLARGAPTIVAGDRAAGAQLAEQSGATVIVMDDGMQNPTLAKSFTLAVIDADYGIGNGRVLPAGPLRAPFGFQLGQCDALLLAGDGEHAELATDAAQTRGLPVFKARLQPADGDWVKGRRIVAFAGIARPDKLFRTILELGGDLVAAQAFADHHVYSARDAARLMAAARQHEALLVTTQKDMARLAGAGGALGELATAAHALPVRMILQEPDRLAGLIDAALQGHADG